MACVGVATTRAVGNHITVADRIKVNIEVELAHIIFCVWSLMLSLVIRFAIFCCSENTSTIASVGELEKPKLCQWLLWGPCHNNRKARILAWME